MCVPNDLFWGLGYFAIPAIVVQQLSSKPDVLYPWHSRLRRSQDLGGLLPSCSSPNCLLAFHTTLDNFLEVIKIFIVQNELSETDLLKKRLPVGANGGVGRTSPSLLSPPSFAITRQLSQYDILHKQRKLAPREFESCWKLGGSDCLTSAPWSQFHPARAVVLHSGRGWEFGADW